ncbi:MAG: hypothetical protein IJY12_01360 [Clostridia bacterium]|nr:hypothetical protein [Clostridia bacterium]
MRSAFAKIRVWLKKAATVLLNPRLVLCFVLAWLITNGWCYIAIALGAWLNVTWLTIVGTAYASFLWFPFTPEKIVTVLLSIFLLRILFPKDEKTLKFLRDKLAALRADIRKKRESRKKSKHKQKTEAE